ncbi:Neural/ectodermal development factor IMP-L2 [Penaeus vannamei]|uniref:Neural/ectodermal development factor IMP-L2 n=1 Tax=Penaeus vannamei TaxID=6689 RepID=A0A3R7PIA0_PENVA|nr:Neural/ectodermal development factor IMP-L2 [Penaeus vannamei]
MNILGQLPVKKETKRSEAVREEERDELLWTSECSPRVAGVRRGQDARLQCEMVAPTGSVLTWFKDDVPLHREGGQTEVVSTSQELLEEATNMLGLEEELLSTASTSASVVQVSSVVYLDCVSELHQATYKLEVTTPRSQRSYSRLFTVVIVGDESEALEEGPTCRLGALVNALPRIYQHSPAAMGHAGDSVTLPCRSQGHNVTREWFLNDERISNDDNYQISGNGDLVLRRLSTQGHTRYTCRATSMRFSALSDTTFTAVVTGFDWGLKRRSAAESRQFLPPKLLAPTALLLPTVSDPKSVKMIRVFMLAVGLAAMAPCDWAAPGSSFHIPSDMHLRLPKFLLVKLRFLDFWALLKGTVKPFYSDLLMTDAWRQHLRQEYIPQRSEAVREEERDEVLWTSECSPRVAGVRRGQDARLQCEMVAPTGSVLTWFKDDVPLLREHLEEATNLLGLEEGKLLSTASTSASVLQISSVVYLDCVSDQHQATYKLEVRPPRSQKSYSRLFTVVIVGDESEALEEGPTCRLGALVNALPRIYQHSPAAMGHAGDSVTLPCRSQGHNVTREWFLNDERISSEDKYLISGNGDLVVRRLGAKGRKRYECKATSTRFSALSDDYVTILGALNTFRLPRTTSRLNHLNYSQIS